MLKLTKTVRQHLDNDECVFQQYCRNFPAKKVTAKGESFWNTHAVKHLLQEDVKCGLAYDMKPAALSATRDEYQEFTLKTFRENVYQEKERQRTHPYWRLKRNLEAQKQVDEERKRMKQEWMETQFSFHFSQMNI